MKTGHFLMAFLLGCAIGCFSAWWAIKAEQNPAKRKTIIAGDSIPIPISKPIINQKRITIEGCEYIEGLGHKGNCRRCIHRNDSTTRRQIEDAFFTP